MCCATWCALWTKVKENEKNISNIEKASELSVWIFLQRYVFVSWYTPELNLQIFSKCLLLLWTSFQKVYREWQARPVTTKLFVSCYFTLVILVSHLRSVEIWRVVCCCFYWWFCRWKSIDCTSWCRTNTVSWRRWSLKSAQKQNKKKN